VNGEIYNHVELREKFCKGMNFRTASDCEVIVHMYERMGADLVQHLDGDFAFILWDSKKKEVRNEISDHQVVCLNCSFL
jgi:asparagine synthase (glutamine-hydrolysing)